MNKHIIAAFGALVSMTVTASAEPAAEPHWSVTAIVGTNVGVDASAGLQVEAPWRLRLSATAGWMPRAYAWGLNKYYQDVYDGPAIVGNLVEDLLAGAFVARANVGFRPLANRGLFVDVGYIVQTTSKSSLVASRFEAETGQELPAADPAEPTEVQDLHHGPAARRDGRLAVGSWQWLLATSGRRCTGNCQHEDAARSALHAVGPREGPGVYRSCGEQARGCRHRHRRTDRDAVPRLHVLSYGTADVEAARPSSR